MIVDILFNFFSILLNVITFILPNWTIPSGVTNAVSDAIGALVNFNVFFPIILTMELVTYLILLYIVILSGRAIFGLVSLVRGGGEMKI